MKLDNRDKGIYAVVWEVNGKTYYVWPEYGYSKCLAYTDPKCTKIAMLPSGHHMMFEVKELVGFETWPWKDVREYEAKRSK